MSEANRTRKRARRKKEGDVLCSVCGNPIPEPANFCPLCGHPRAFAPEEELLSRPMSEPPIGDVPEIEPMPEEDTALPPPSAVPSEATGSPPALAAEGKSGEQAQAPEVGDVAARGGADQFGPRHEGGHAGGVGVR